MEIVLSTTPVVDIFISDYLIINNEEWFMTPSQIYNRNNVNPNDTIIIYPILNSSLLSLFHN